MGDLMQNPLLYIKELGAGLKRVPGENELVR